MTDGLAVFSGCSVSLPGQGYVIEAGAAFLTGVASEGFGIIWAGDLDGNGHTDIVDFSILIASFGSHAPS